MLARGYGQLAPEIASGPSTNRMVGGFGACQGPRPARTVLLPRARPEAPSGQPVQGPAQPAGTAGVIPPLATAGVQLDKDANFMNYLHDIKVKLFEWIVFK